jgi:hypothetical protein
MKKNNIAGILLSAISLSAVISCSNANSASSDSIPEQKLQATSKKEESINIIRFKVNGTQVTTGPWVITRFTMSGHAGLNITSSMKKDKRTVQFNLNDDKAGNYTLALSPLGAKGGNTGYGDYKPDYEHMLESYSFRKGQLIINSIDTLKGILNAEFSGTVTNNNGTSFSITDGKIVNGSINDGVIHY